jgi:hypothetical protein
MRAKIFHFTEIRFRRMCCPPWSGTRGGRTSSRAADRGAVDAGSVVHEGREQGGLNPVRSRLRADERRSTRTAKSRGPGCRCYSQALRRRGKPDRATRAANSRGDGGKQELVSGESAPYAVRPSRREGRTFFGFTCPSVVHCVCISSHDGPRVPAGARPSLRPFFERGVTPSAKHGRKRREDEELCLRVTYLLSSPAQDIIGWAKRKRAHACRVAIELVGTALCAFARTTAPRVKMRFGGAR